MSFNGRDWGRHKLQQQPPTAEEQTSWGRSAPTRPFGRPTTTGSDHYNNQRRGRGRGSRRTSTADQGGPADQEQAAPPTQALPHVAQYLQKWHPLVAAELSAEQAIVHERLATWPLDRLKREGLVLLGLTAAKRGSLYGLPIWVLRQADRGYLPFHRFVAGDEVLISKHHPLNGPGRALSGSVLERGSWELRIVSNDKLPTDGTPVRLDKGVNTVVYDRMRAALDSLAKQPPPHAPVVAAAAAAEGGGGGGAADSQWPFLITNQLQQAQPQQHQHKRGKRQRNQDEPDTSPPGTSLADVMINPSAAAAAGPSSLMPQAALDWARGMLQQQSSSPQQQLLPSSSGSSSDQGLAARDAELGLNRSQLAAIANCILNKVALIHGPPGTGKTTTTVALLAQLVRRFKLPLPLLAVAQSHVAVDNLLEGLVDSGVNAVRMGQPVKVRESLRNATVDARLEAHPKTHEVETTAQQLRDLRARLPMLHGRDKGLGHRDVSIMAGKVTSLKEQLVAEVLQGAQVICATCAATGSDMLQGVTFPVVVLDEASQASEPEALIPITRGAEHVVLVGDHQQLPPVVNSDAAVAGGMAVSLFEKLMNAGVPNVLLQVQYRMHPCLSAFPNLAFYGGRLVDGITASQRPLVAGFPWPNQQRPLVFIDVDGREELASGGSKLNRAEADFVEVIIRHLITISQEQRSSIGVITPYLAQLNLLSQQLTHLKAGPWVQQAARSNASAAPAALDGDTGGRPNVAGRQGPATAVESDGYYGVDSIDGNGAADVLEIKTVDGYQGREKQIVVFSAVRANQRAQVGFLGDWRRLNVAITRPRRGLILVGNAATLSAGDDKWRSYLQWLRQQGCVVAAQQIQQQMGQTTAVAHIRATLPG